MSRTQLHGKGIFWIDRVTGRGLGGFIVADLDSDAGSDSIPPSTPTILQLGSNSFGPGQLPREAKQAVVAWLSDEHIRVDRVEFFHGSGGSVIVDDMDLAARPAFTPPAGGPAFDCAHAGTDVEHAICSDTGLAAQDLALSKLYNQIRLGAAHSMVASNYNSSRDDGCNNATAPVSPSPTSRPACACITLRRQLR